MPVLTWRDDLKIAYSDDPDLDYAGSYGRKLVTA